MEPGDKKGQPRLWSPVFVLIIALTLCCFMMGQGLNSGTSVFLVGEGYGAALAGALALAFSAAAAASRIAVGPVIDGGRCSAVIIGGITVLIAGTFMSAVVQGVPLFTVSRLLQGAGFGAATTAASTAAASVLPAARLGEGIGYHGLGQALSMSIGPALALYLVGTDPATNLYVGLSLVGVVGLAIAFNARYERTWRKLPPTCAYRRKMEALQEDPAAGSCRASSKRTLRDALNILEPRALPGAIPMAILCPTFGFGIFFTGLYGTTLGYEHAGLFYTVSAVSMVIVRLCSKSFMDTVPAIKTYTVAVVCALAESAMLLAARCRQEHPAGALGCHQRPLPAHQRCRHRPQQLDLGRHQRRLGLPGEHHLHHRLPGAELHRRLAGVPRRCKALEVARPRHNAPRS